MLDIITLGGTIDKIYGSGKGIRNLSFNPEPVIAQILKRHASGLSYTLRQLMALDSLDMGETEHLKVREACLHPKYHNRRIVIVQGTDGMIETARFLATHPEPRDLAYKVIVLTGALQPAAMRESDAEFNVGSAVMAAQCLTGRGDGPTVAIAMSGQWLEWDKCYKDPDTGIFVPHTNPPA